MVHLIKIQLSIEYFFKIRLNMAFFIVVSEDGGSMPSANVKISIAVRMALAGFCVAVMILAAQAPLVAAEPEQEEFKFIHENSDPYENYAVVLPATPSAPTYAAQSDGSVPTVRPQTSSPVVRPSPYFTVAVSPDSQRLLNRIVVQSWTSGQLVTRDVDSYTSGAGMLAVTERVQRSVSFTIYVSSLNGFSGSVKLSVSGVPSGASCSFPSSMRVPENGQAITFLDITTTSSTPKGTYTLTVTITGGGISRSDSVELKVNEETKLEGGAPSYVKVDDGMGSGLGGGGSRGFITSDYYAVPDRAPPLNIGSETVPNNGAGRILADKIGAAGNEVKLFLNQNVIQPATSAVNKVVQAVQIALNALKNLFRK